MPDLSYTIVRELSPASLLARDASSRNVVLKTLPPDCLLNGQLNPNIAERLRRVREIAMTAVANLRGVERMDDRIVLVWDFVEGVDFGSYASSAERSSEDVVRLVRELIHTVKHFHATGLVHGALQKGNVLVDSNGRIRLIDVSPLLFLDPLRDERAVVEMCRELVNARHDSDSVLAAAVVAAADSKDPMNTLSQQLSVNRGASRPSSPRVSVRRRSLIAALIFLVVGTGLTIGINRIVHRSQPAPMTPPHR